MAAAERLGRWAWASVAFVLLCAAAPAVDWSSPQRVDVVTRDYEFVPNRLTFQHGTVYRLHLVNQGKELHDFTAPGFFATLTIRNPAVVTKGLQEISVPVGGSVDMDFVPNKAGQYELRCADHDWAGMVGTILVK